MQLQKLVQRAGTLYPPSCRHLRRRAWPARKQAPRHAALCQPTQGDNGLLEGGLHQRQVVEDLRQHLHIN
eukprot:1055457-Pleurochrysis_carterae.AAC.1